MRRGKLMNRPITIIILITLIFTFAAGIFWLQKSSGIQTTSKNLDVKNSSVEEILKLYWSASLKGDADEVKQLSSFPPEDFLQDCSGTKKTDTANSDFYPVPLAASNSDKDASKDKDDEIQMKNPFIDSAVPGPVKATSEYIYLSKISFDRVKIIDKKVYQNEAILEVQKSDLSGNFSNSFKHIYFFKNDGLGWKIIGIGDKDVLLLISKQINYAIARPPCGEK